MKELRNDFKTNNFKPVYLLYGDEVYLVRHYAKEFANLPSDPMMNCDTFEGKDFQIRSAIDAAETFPFLSDWRVVIIKDSGLATTGRKDDTEEISKYLPNIPESTIIVFVESSVDKRNKLFKQISSLGRVVECGLPSEGELIRWLTNIFKKKGKIIDANTARVLLNTVPKGMDSIYAEADKLEGFVGERQQITVEDIQQVCTKSLEARIFDLVAALCNGQTEKALTQYHNMLVMKEQPLMMLAMMARQFRLILQCKACAEKGIRDIAGTLGLRDFIVRECLRQGNNFTKESLIAALSDCQDTDIRIKTGLIDGELGVELLIVRYSLCKSA